MCRKWLITSSNVAEVQWATLFIRFTWVASISKLGSVRSAVKEENIWCGTDFEIFDLSFEQFDVLTDYLKDLNI